MLRRVPLVVALALLAWTFWASPTISAIAAGVAVFLFGMMALEQGLKGLTGGVLERLLRRSTDRLWKGLTFGAAATALTQSSTLVSLLTISFLSSGLLGLHQGLGVVFGANLGTTTGAWLMAGPALRFNIGQASLPLLTFGVAFILTRHGTLRPLGWILAGLGFLLLGIQWMKDGFEVFQQAFDLTDYAMTGLSGLAVYTVIGVLATVIMQSSHATLIVTITALAAGQISYENALAVSIGANIGTAVSTALAAIAANVEGRRLAGAHVLFNVGTAAVALVLIAPFMYAVDTLAQLLGIAPEQYVLKLALFHTLFNLAGIAIMVPLIPVMVTVLERVLRGKPPIITQPRYINPNMRALPDAALEAVRRELLRLFRRVSKLMARGLYFDWTELRNAESRDELLSMPDDIRPVDMDGLYYERVKPLHGLILDFLASVPVRNQQAELAGALRSACQSLVEAVKHGRHLQPSLVKELAGRHAELSREYLAIRANLGWLLKCLDEMAEASNERSVTNDIKELAAFMRDRDVVRSGRLDELIRNGKITPTQASSLMNDGAYARRLGKNLLKMARILFRAPGETEVEREEEGSLEAATED